MNIFVSHEKLDSKGHSIENHTEEQKHLTSEGVDSEDEEEEIDYEDDKEEEDNRVINRY